MNNLAEGNDPVKPEGNCYGYVRMSTDKQDDSPEVQTRILQEWADDQGIEITILVENAITAFNQDFVKRPIGKMLARKLQRGDWLVATRIDRIARRRGEQYLIDRLRKRGVRVTTLENMSIDPDSPMGVIQEGVQLTFAEYDSTLKSVRIKETFAYRRSLGLPTNGRADYGHKIVHVAKEVHPRHKTIFEERPSGEYHPITGKTLDKSIGEQDLLWIARAAYARMEGMTCKMIVNWFREQGVRSPFWSRIKKCYLPWSRMRVSRATNWFWEINKLRPPKWAKCQRRKYHKREPLISSGLDASLERLDDEPEPED